MCNYFQGKGGDKPTKDALNKAIKIRKAYYNWVCIQAKGKTIPKNSILLKTLAVYNRTRDLVLTGNPEEDWQVIRHTMEKGDCNRINKIAKEVRNISVLGRGTQFRQALSQDWLDNGGYLNAFSITRQAFIREHFFTNDKPEKGVVVMNMHKAKGKQFDEVIIFEGWGNKANRIVRFNSINNIDNQTRQIFHVSVTRAKSKTTILTPKDDPCVLLPQKKTLYR